MSDREFAPQLSNIEFNYATNRPTYIYAMALRKDVKQAVAKNGLYVDRVPVFRIVWRHRGRCGLTVNSAIISLIT